MKEKRKTKIMALRVTEEDYNIINTLCMNKGINKQEFLYSLIYHHIEDYNTSVTSKQLVPPTLEGS